MLQLVSLICHAVLLLGTHFVVGEDKHCSCTTCDWSNHFVTNGTITQENIAIGKEANMSQAWDRSGPACLAVDGNTDRTFGYNPNPNCISTANAVGNHYWQVDLGDWIIVEYIIIFTMKLYEKQMYNVDITVDDQHCYTFAASGNIRDVENVTCRQARIGRVIKFSRVSEAAPNYIGFCEIQVWRRFCSCIPHSCDFSNHCVPAGNCKKVNVALGMAASMSQEWQNSGPACLAVDGNTNGAYGANPTPNCISTAENINNPFWQVDLGQQFKVKYITVYTMDSYRDQMHNVKITVDNQECYTFGSSAINPVENVACHQARTGRYVKFNETASYLAFCEVQVWICIDRTYGADCAQTCGQCMDKEPCDIETGKCDSCEHGFSPPLCQTCLPGLSPPLCQTCQPGLYPPLCQLACNNGTYGQNCSQPCGNCTSNAQCDPVNGTCTLCSPGFIPPLCQSPCNNKTYGQDCLLPCGNCTGNVQCNPLNGICTSCSPGFFPPLCQSPCNNKTYGQDCLRHCGNCTGNLPCNPANGICASCSPGFIPPLCQSPCNNKTYGQDCLSVCGNCTSNVSCDTVNGICTSCSPGFYPPLCQSPCTNKTYGQDCLIPCGNCAGGVPCDHVNGICESCSPGFISPLCQSPCSSQSYGINCSLPCGNCTDGEQCDPVNGVCRSCEPGFIPPLCQSHCDHGQYEQNCNTSCGKCFNNVTCHHITGQCENGCDDKFTGPRCQELIKEINIIGPVLGGIAGAIVLVVITFVLFWMRRKRFFYKNDSSNNFTDASEHSDNLQSAEVLTAVIKPKIAVKPQLKSESKTKIDHDTDKGDHTYSNTSMDSLTPLYGNTSTSNDQVYQNVTLTSMDKQPVKIKGLKETGIRPAECDSNDGIENIVDDSDDIYNTEDIYSNFQQHTSFARLDALQRSLISSLASGHLSKLFKTLPTGMKYSHEEGKKPSNMKKNRYKAVLPYDTNRVVLVRSGRSEKEADTDYINASFITAYQREKGYIASQGPRHHTIDDMWWMIWQESVTQIVMLTNLKEDGKDKCEEYWPPAGCTRVYGHVTVTCISVEQRADFIIRKFSIKVKENTFLRHIEQYHYTSWPDHGVPTATSLVNFWRYIKARIVPHSPVIVHCSAGIGRTGTYIALDIAMDTAVHNHDVNVHKIVADLREERLNMVQVEAQYKFLYEAFLEAYSSRATRLTSEQLDVMFPQAINVQETNLVIDKEYKMLQQMGAFLPKPTYVMAASKENIEKNRNRDALPDDNNLAYVSVHVKGRNAYINAVFAPTFKNRKGILLTQLPFPDTLVDIWRLVDDKNVNTIVSIGSIDEKETVKDFCQYWPLTAGDVVAAGPYTIRQTRLSSLNDHMTSFQLEITKETTIREVRLLRYTNWVAEVPEDTEDLIQLIEAINTNRSETDTTPVVVQCIDGAAKSGLFCVLWEIIERAKCDQENDVFLSARKIQVIRPQAVTSEVQYRYCYKFAQDYQRHSGVYENM